MNVVEAEKAVATILAQLEVDQDTVVIDIAIGRFDVRSIDSIRHEYIVRVNITTQRKPGHLWGQITQL